MRRTSRLSLVGLGGGRRAASRPTGAEVDRRPGIGDVMTLVAASALALAGLRGLAARAPLTLGVGPRVYLAAGFWVLSSLTPAALLARLRRPRPPLRALARRPGFAATAAVTAIVAFCALAIGVSAVARATRPAGPAGRGRPEGFWDAGGPWVWFQGLWPEPLPGGGVPDPLWWLDVVYLHGWMVGPTIFAGWVLLSLGSPRRPPGRGWPERLGRGLGAAWIALWAVDCVIRFVGLLR